jgi:hypothetical protein
VWRYLKSAFLVGVPAPGLRHVPVNAVLAAGLGALGFLHPAFWLLGVALQGIVVPGLAFNRRFQKYVEATDLKRAEDDDEAKRQALVELLDKHSQHRMTQLALKCSRVLELLRSQQAENYLFDLKRSDLNRLLWVYLKLLVAHHHLQAPSADGTEASLQREIAAIGRQLEHMSGPDSLRESRVATQAMLEERLANVRKREHLLAEINSDLRRIEVQVELSMEKAAMPADTETIGTDITLASDLSGHRVFGDYEAEVCALDRRYCTQQPQKAAVRESP